jgi:D-threonate/D-erythronate kinase
MPSPLTIVADDLTGACDTGAVFAGRGPVPITVWPQPAEDADVRAVDTESRTAPAADAALRVARAGAGPGLAFKKIDSTLRGAIGAEVEALWRASGARMVLLCPAFPAQGRVVVDRVLRVHGVPVAESALARDPDFPRGGSSSVIDVLRPQIQHPLAWLPLEHVRGDRDALAARLARLDGMVAVADAATDADLDALAAAALSAASPPLLAGSAGLARALAERLGCLAPPAALPAGCRWLFVAGSRHPATREQIAGARAAGLDVIATPDADASDRDDAGARLAAQARATLARGRHDGVVVTGGETAVALYRALGAARIDVLGAPVPGLALGRLVIAGRAPLAIVTKAGGFGAPDLLVSLVKEAVA